MWIKPQCAKCKHYKDGFECEAFERIPEEVLSWEQMHDKPLPNDNGIRYEAK